MFCYLFECKTLPLLVSIQHRGQPHLRSEDRYRHVTTDRVRTPNPYSMKRKRSHERALTLEERRERALSRSSGKVAQRAAPAPMMVGIRQTPAFTQSSTPSPTNSILPTHVYYTPVMDEPLALIKKPRKDRGDKEEEEAKNRTSSRVQVRPSVITCVSSSRSPSCSSDVHGDLSPVMSQPNYDHVLEEHFQRSLGVNYQRAHNKQLSINVSVDDHFAKALGDKWLQIKSKSSSCSSTPPSSPSVTHSPSYSHSPTQSHKESRSTSSPPSSHWAVN
ncbi:vestigial like 4 like isoform X2 [Gouania willdenowi]|uniref:vestigial like 4 like isoform X2 n=1 Tax=Gouania willdenowi TaxID=441366 RepID=UPI001055E00B|nr:transcription cofactor vestigial-like protein 4 isoform X2 [Gouania willdenowi]